jgi:zinc transporter ZupT
MGFSCGPVLEAAIFGWISAISFPLGVALAVNVRDPKQFRGFVAWLLAFASGAVVASLMMEVFAVTIDKYIDRASEEAKLKSMHPGEDHTPLAQMAAESGVDPPGADETAHCAKICLFLVCAFAPIGAQGFLLIHQAVLSRMKWAKNDDEQLALTIILGQVVDGVPEACLIGLFTLRHELSLVLLLSLFVANLPESISVTLLHAIPVKTVAAIWSSLAFATGLLSAITAAVFVAIFPTLHGTVVDDYVFAVLEGLAAGAMLVVVGGSYLPEAARYQTHGAAGVPLVLGVVTAGLVKAIGGVVSFGGPQGHIDIPNLTTMTDDLKPWGVEGDTLPPAFLISTLTQNA